ncbi:unnamed protein product [Adineta ricciae]|uniref:Uncharacterized protein n=1 Tax=Adineta ricciae TaxID=249248 RepID=A0A816B479_ADIRI|nr:unnamed protein product [Adineta ricciae]
MSTNLSSSRDSSAAVGLNSFQKKFTNTVIDYSPWMRQQARSAPPVKPKPTVIVHPPPERGETKCSEVCCRHLRKKSAPGQQVIPDNPEKIQWLTFQLHMHQTRIETFLQRENQLKEDNAKLREMIINTERSSHETVAANLRRFDQYKKTISLVETKQSEEKQVLLEAINSERKRIVNELEMYENQILELDEQIAEQQQLLKKLKTYKDTEYPEKERVLQKLLQEISEINLFNSEEVDELTRILEKQQKHYLDKLRTTVARIREEQATAAFSTMHKSYLLVALDNDQMREEINIQEEKLRLMELEIEHIRKLNAQLKQQQKEAFNPRTLFPHVFRHETLPICTPDMDIVLDLPDRRSPLPV